jgi:tetratricopeptide (TPR) repeat protein
MALDITDIYIREHPGDREGLLYRATYMALLGRSRDAMNALAELEKDVPPCPEVFTVKVMVNRLTGDTFAGISSCKEALKSQCNNHVLLLNLGYLSELSDDLDEALACYNKILKSNPGDERALYRKSIVLFKKDMPEEGLLCVDSIVEYKPRSANAWKSKGAFLYAHDKEEEAQWSFNRAVENNPDDFVALFNLVLLLNKVGKHQEAVVFLEKLESFEPYCSDVYILKGDTLALLGKAEPALEAYDRSLYLEPGSIRASLHKAMLLQMSGREEKAVGILNSAIERDPLNISLWSNAAFILTNLLRYDEARDYLEKAKTLDERNHIVHYNLGILHLYTGNHAAASRALDSVLYIKPDFFDGWFARGVVAELMGAGEEALNYYDQASRREQKNPLVWHHRGNALMSLSRFDEAVRAYTQAIKVQNTFEMSWLYKARALVLLNREAEANQCLTHFEDLTGRKIEVREIPPPACDEAKRLFPLKMLQYELPFLEDNYVPLWAD